MFFFFKQKTAYEMRISDGSSDVRSSDLSGKERSLNLKGAYLEVWADMLGSIGVIAGAIAIRFTGMTWIDPVVAVGIGLWVLPRTWILLRDTANVLLEGVPRGMSLDEVRRAIGAVPGVQSAHDLHVWSIPSGNVRNGRAAAREKGVQYV